MRGKLLILILILWFNGIAQTVPNTTTFSLADVQSAVGSDNLSGCFSAANANYFDPLYAGSKDNLLNFRNYHCRRGTSVYNASFYYVYNGITMATGTICGSFNYGSSGTYYSGQVEYVNALAYSGTGDDCVKISPSGYYLIPLTYPDGPNYMHPVQITSTTGAIDWNICPEEATVYTGSSATLGSTSVTVNTNQIGSQGYYPLQSKGICWSTTANPVMTGNHTDDGATLANWNATATGLSPSTTYHFRAYGYNQWAGVGYGGDVTFTTTSGVVVPTVSTSAMASTTYNTASGGGNVTADGGASVTARGIAYSSSTNAPTIVNSPYTSDGSGTGVFSSSLSGLTGNTYYYSRAYATNSAGTGYGSYQVILTKSDISWSFTSGGTSDFIQIKINGTQVVNTTSTSSGHISASIGDSIEVTTDPGSADFSEISMTINGGTPITDSQATPTQSYVSGTVSGNVSITSSTHN